MGSFGCVCAKLSYWHEFTLRNRAWDTADTTEDEDPQNHNLYGWGFSSLMICLIRASVGLFFKWWNMRQAKSVWRPSSREISSLLKVRPGIKPRFFSQKIAANEPEKKIPSTEAYAMIRSA